MSKRFGHDAMSPTNKIAASASFLTSLVYSRLSFDALGRIFSPCDFKPTLRTLACACQQLNADVIPTVVFNLTELGGLGFSVFLLTRFALKKLGFIKDGIQQLDSSGPSGNRQSPWFPLPANDAATVRTNVRQGCRGTVNVEIGHCNVGVGPEITAEHLLRVLRVVDSLEGS